MKEDIVSLLSCIKLLLLALLLLTTIKPNEKTGLNAIHYLVHVLEEYESLSNDAELQIGYLQEEIANMGRYIYP